MRIPLPSPVLNEENCVGCFECMKACARHHLGNDKDLEHVCFKVSPIGNSFHVTACFECGRCEKACPTGAIKKNHFGISKINPALCTQCGKCVKVCPDKLIDLQSYSQEI